MFAKKKKNKIKTSSSKKKKKFRANEFDVKAKVDGNTLTNIAQDSAVSSR